MSDLDNFYTWMTEERGGLLVTEKGGAGSGRYPKGSGAENEGGAVRSAADQASMDKTMGMYANYNKNYGKGSDYQKQSLSASKTEPAKSPKKTGSTKLEDVDLTNQPSHAEYNKREQARSDIIRSNAGARISGKPQKEVPPKVEKPKVFVAYDKSGGYIGSLPNAKTLSQAIDEVENVIGHSDVDFALEDLRGNK